MDATVQDAECATAIRQYLKPDERLVWTGRPRQGFRLYWPDVIALPYTAFFAGFIVWFWWQIAAPLSGYVFLVLAVASVAGVTWSTYHRFAWDAARRARTCYALTNRRALISGTPGSAQPVSIDLRNLKDLSFSVHSDGHGTLAFHSVWPDPPSLFRDLGMSRLTRGLLRPSFVQIENVKEVYACVQEIRGKLKGAA
jgi:hypothetical protein